MKCLICVLFLQALSIHYASSQLIDSIYPEMNERNRVPWNWIFSLHPLDDTSFVAVSLFGRVYGMHVNGSILWETGVQYSDVGSYMITGATLATDNANPKLILSYLDDECDTYGGFFHTILDLNTKELITPVAPSGYSKRDRYIFPELPGLPEYLFSGDSSFVLNYGPDSNTVYNFFNRILRIDINENGDFAILTGDSLFLYQFNNGIFTLTQKEPHLVGGSKSWIRFSTDSTILINSTNGLHLFDQDLKYVRSYLLPDIPSGSIDQRNWQAPYVVIMRGSLESSQLVVLDPFLIAVFETEIPFYARANNDVLYSGDSVVIFSGGMYNYYNRRNFLKGYDFNEGANNTLTDIAISGWHYDKLISKSEYGCLMDELDSYELSNVEVDIKNEGNTIITSAVIASEASVCAFYCSPEALYHYTIQDIQLMPGETRTFSLGTITIEDEQYYIDNGLCLYAIMPDDHFDANGYNDFFCIIPTVSTLDQHESALQIYPNPASDEISISGAHVEKVFIFDINGRSMDRVSFQPQIQRVDVSELSTGIYFMRALTDVGLTRMGYFIKN